MFTNTEINAQKTYININKQKHGYTNCTIIRLQFPSKTFCINYMTRFFFIFCLHLICVGSAWSFSFFHPRHNGQWLLTSNDFHPRFYPLLHLILPYSPHVMFSHVYNWPLQYLMHMKMNDFTVRKVWETITTTFKTHMLPAMYYDGSGLLDELIPHHPWKPN